MPDRMREAAILSAQNRRPAKKACGDLVRPAVKWVESEIFEWAIGDICELVSRRSAEPSVLDSPPVTFESGS